MPKLVSSKSLFARKSAQHLECNTVQLAWNVSGNNAVRGPGRVGINISDPLTLLHVIGSEGVEVDLFQKKEVELGSCGILESHRFVLAQH